MLVQLTPIQEEIDRCYQVAKENNFTYYPQHQRMLETGIYYDNGFNFRKFEFVEMEKHTYDDEKIFTDYSKSEYGVADNVEQIKEYFKDEISDTENKYVISLTPVGQDKDNKGKGGGWRWHKWGPYIGILNRECEYIDDEDFGDDFEYVLVFHLYKIKD
jgi:hypothetical protein